MRTVVKIFFIFSCDTWKEKKEKENIIFRKIQLEKIRSKMSESNNVIDRLKARHIFSRLADKKKLIVSYYMSRGFPATFPPSNDQSGLSSV